MNLKITLNKIKEESNSELKKDVVSILLNRLDKLENLNNEIDFFKDIWNKDYKKTKVRLGEIEGLSNYSETYLFAKKHRKEIKRLYREQGIEYKLLSKKERSIYSFEAITDEIQQNYILTL